MIRPPELQKIHRVAVFGLARSGVAAVRLLKRFEIETHAVNEGPVENWRQRDGLGDLLGAEFCHEQSSAEGVFGQVDLIILSPGIPKTHTILKLAREKHVRVISEIELAYWCTVSVPVIAITGTNGKTTTTTMIYESLKVSGSKVFCGGNIGIPYCDMALQMMDGIHFDYAVIEVSSFHLETIEKFHPHIALILNLTPNHSERYSRHEDYGLAKLNILKNMTKDDHLIIGEETGMMMEWVKNYLPVRHVFSKERLPQAFEAQFEFNQGVLVGRHNRANYFCAWKVHELLGTAKLTIMFQTFINTFKGVEHRLEYVGTFGELKVYNDAKSTNGEATRTALAAFEGEAPLYLVVGGKLRNQTDKLLPDLLPFKGRVKKVFTMGETTQRLFDELKSDFIVEQGHDLDQLLNLVKSQKLKGNLVFSPAHPSFDQFKSYVNRGETFKAKVKMILGN